MSVLHSAQVRGPGGSAAVRLTGPALLGQPTATVAAWRTAVQPDVRLLANVLRSEAQAAYSGTRFAGAFGYRTTVQPTATLTLFNTHPLFRVVEEPTRPHTITARRGPYLHFKIGARWVKVASVAHPGTKGRNALPAILARYDSTFRRLMAAALTEVLTRG